MEALFFSFFLHDEIKFQKTPDLVYVILSKGNKSKRTRNRSRTVSFTQFKGWTSIFVNVKIERSLPELM